MRIIHQAICALTLAMLLLSGMAAVADASGQLHGNAKSRIYHNSGCRYYNCKACTVVFNSREQARAAGFRACKVCGG